MYEIILEEPAKQFIRTLAKNKQKRILDKIEKLGENPRLGDSLVGKLSGIWSARIDEFRVPYTFKDIELIVLILKVRHRKVAYSKKI